MKNKHQRAPLYEALEQYTHQNLVHFDVPGHKKRMHTGLGEFFGERILGFDANSTRALDNLSNPDGVIKEAETLLADAYWADHAFMLVNGSTFGVQTMIMSVCSPKDKILMPRNVHKSAVNAVILSGAIPVFIDPEINTDYGIANGVSFDQVKKAVQENPDAKAIFLINPTYFGVVSDLRAIIKLCRRRGLLVLVDEAHGAHFPFHNEFPDNAAALGADMATVSLHKTGGSLTQSSVLLLNERNIDVSIVRTTINLMQTTSASYLLMASLDLARRNMEINGNKIYDELLPVVEKAKAEINKTPGLSVLSRDDINGQVFYDFDESKFVVRVNELGMTGFEVYDMLMDEYGIQVELAESYVILAIAGIADDAGTIAKLVEALKDIAARHHGKKQPFELEQIDAFEKPMAVVSPRDAFYSPKRLVHVNESVGEICAESIMIYPPGIPLAVPGEKITQGIVDHFNFYRQQHCIIMHNSEDPDMLQVLGEAVE